jgi:hypothetical protein
VKPPGEPGLKPEHPIVLPGEPGLKPEHPIALPPGASTKPAPPGKPAIVPPSNGQPPPQIATQPIAYPPPTYVGQHPYWSPAATFFAGAFVGAAFGYGLNWGGGDIDINYGNNCCRGGNINGGRGDHVDHRVGDRFNADKQRVNGSDKLKWNGNKARQKAATGKPAAARAKAGTLPAKNARTGAAAKQKGTAGAGNKARAGDLQPNKGNGGSLGNYQSGIRPRCQQARQPRQPEPAGQSLRAGSPRTTIGPVGPAPSAATAAAARRHAPEQPRLAAVSHSAAARGGGGGGRRR